MVNKTKIEWTDYTWNPVTGCLRGCEYCYARRIAERFNKPYGFYPTYHIGRLQEPLKVKKPSRILVCSMADLFGEWWFSVDNKPLNAGPTIVNSILDIVRQCPQHTFQFLTKSPQHLAFGNPWPANCWVGVTATDWGSYLTALMGLKEVKASVRFVSLEPLLENVPLAAAVVGTNGDCFGVQDLDWLIVGAQTGPGAKPPENGWVAEIVGVAEAASVPLFLKDNLGWPGKRQEWPAAAYQTESKGGETE